MLAVKGLHNFFAFEDATARGGPIAKWIALSLCTQWPPLWFSALTIFIDSTVKNSGQRLDNVNRINLVLARSKLVLQKEIKKIQQPISDGRGKSC